MPNSSDRRRFDLLILLEVVQQLSYAHRATRSIALVSDVAVTDDIVHDLYSVVDDGEDEPKKRLERKRRDGLSDYAR